MGIQSYFCCLTASLLPGNGIVERSSRSRWLHYAPAMEVLKHKKCLIVGTRNVRRASGLLETGLSVTCLTGCGISLPINLRLGKLDHGAPSRPPAESPWRRFCQDMQRRSHGPSPSPQPTGTSRRFRDLPVPLTVPVLIRSGPRYARRFDWRRESSAKRLN